MFFSRHGGGYQVVLDLRSEENEFEYIMSQKVSFLRIKYPQSVVRIYTL